MHDFMISPQAGKKATCILVGYFSVSIAIVIAVLSGYLGTRNSPYAAYVVGPILSFATASLFYIRKIYLIIFANPQGDTSGTHDTAFLIYVLVRPLFAVLIALLSILALEHLVHAIVIEPQLSEGFMIAAAILGVLLGSITGLAINALTEMGQRAVAKLDAM
jgi:hypothetical protein